MKTNKKAIRRILKAKGITLDVLAWRMNLSSPQAARYRIYNAKKLTTIQAIAKALRVKVNAII